MGEHGQTPSGAERAIVVAAGKDRLGEHRGLGISVIDFKVLPRDGEAIFIIENTFHARGGPARHLHYAQDEWFYVAEGEFIFEVGSDKMRLKEGDLLSRRAKCRTYGPMMGKRGVRS